MIYGAPNNPLRPLEDEIRAVAALGFDYLELCLDPPGALPETLRPRLAAVRSVLDGEGLALPVVHLPTFVWLADIYASIREASVAEVLKALELAAELGVTKAVLHPGYLTGLLNFTPDVGGGYAAETLERVLAGAADLGVTVCLENLFPRAGHMYRPEEFAACLAAHAGLMMTLDLGHANIRAPRDRVRAFVAAARGRIGHLHIGDNNGREDEHLPLGAGRLDATAALGEVKAAGYDGTMTLEIFTPDREYLAVSLRKVREIWDALPG